jgi:hypothetical protein
LQIDLKELQVNSLGPAQANLWQKPDYPGFSELNLDDPALRAQLRGELLGAALPGASSVGAGMPAANVPSALPFPQNNVSPVTPVPAPTHFPGMSAPAANIPPGNWPAAGGPVAGEPAPAQPSALPAGQFLPAARTQDPNLRPSAWQEPVPSQNSSPQQQPAQRSLSPGNGRHFVQPALRLEAIPAQAGRPYLENATFDIAPSER